MAARRDPWHSAKSGCWSASEVSSKAGAQAARDAPTKGGRALKLYLAWAGRAGAVKS
jgi:hypothetical protein